MDSPIYPPTPKHSKVLDLAHGTVTHQVDFRGSQSIPERPPLMNCDFCMARSDRLWGFQTWPVCIYAGPIRVSDEGSAWWACVQCAALVRARLVDVLVARVIALQPDISRGYLRPLYSVLFEVMHGEELTWSASEKWRVIRAEGR